MSSTRVRTTAAVTALVGALALGSCVDQKDTVTDTGPDPVGTQQAAEAAEDAEGC